jgi:hypothetical protein
MTPHASCMQCHCYCMHCACGVIDTACTRAWGVSDTAYTLNAVSLTPHAFLIFVWHSIARKFFCACRVIDTACTMHAVSMTLHAPCMRCQWYRMHTCMRCQWYCMHPACDVNDTACILNKSNIFANTNLYSKRLWPLKSGAQDRCSDEKNRGAKSSWHCPLKLAFFGELSV